MAVCIHLHVLWRLLCCATDCNGIQSAPLTITAPDGSVSPPIYTATVMTPDGTTMADGLASTLPACGGARRVEEERQMLATTVQLDISIVNLQGVSHSVPGTTTTITYLNKLDEFIKLLPELGLEVKYSACIAAKTCKKVSLDITPVVVPTDPGGGHSGGDPWVEGYLGQHFYIEVCLHYRLMYSEAWVFMVLTMACDMTVPDRAKMDGMQSSLHLSSSST
jgi:hypothetical protein